MEPLIRKLVDALMKVSEDRKIKIDDITRARMYEAAVQLNYISWPDLGPASEALEDKLGIKEILVRTA